MVSSRVSQFISGLEEDGPLLEQQALTPTQLDTAARFDIQSGILDAKDFPKNLDLSKVEEEFKEIYVSLMRAVRSSANNVFEVIARHADNIPAYYPSEPNTFGTVAEITPILQMVENAFIETNNAHINLTGTLSRIRGDLQRFGPGMPVTVSRSIMDIARLAQELETTTANRDSILRLFTLHLPHDKVEKPLSTAQTKRAADAMSRLSRLTTTGGRDQRRNYAIAIQIMIKAHLLAVEAVTTFYQVGGRNVELVAMSGGADSLPLFEKNALTSHDHIRTNVVRILNRIATGPTAAVIGLDPAQVAQIQSIATSVNKEVLRAAPSGRAKRESFLEQKARMQAILSHTNRAFEIIVTP